VPPAAVVVTLIGKFAVRPFPPATVNAHVPAAAGVIVNVDPPAAAIVAIPLHEPACPAAAVDAVNAPA
jgi:Na+-transporting methylmalonyl-CoA/oxaloacetate decarboxylase gamma subunit